MKTAALVLFWLTFYGIVGLVVFSPLLIWVLEQGK